MLSFLHQSVQTLLSLLIPPRASETLVARLSSDELRGLALSGETSCEALLPYHEPRVKALVWELKYYRNGRALRLAGELLAPRVAEMSAEELGELVLIPIPMDRGRLRERGGNHAEALCREVARHTDCVVATHALQKTKETPRQVTLPAAARLTNLTRAFAADSALVHGRSCLVIDDVTTTGATFREATRALGEAGARRVLCLALASS